MIAYRIEARFYSPLALYDMPMLDSLIAWALDRETACVARIMPSFGVHGRYNHYRDLLTSILGMVDDVTVCSPLKLGHSVRFTDFACKRFESKFAHLADFGKARRRINKQGLWSGSRKRPIPCYSAPCGEWHFVGHGPRVLQLLQQHVVGVGRWVDSGWGWVSSFSLQESNLDMLDIMKLRPVPVALAKRLGLDGERRLCTWRLPYWLTEDGTECIVA